MGSYDGAEVCELVRLYLLNKLTHLVGAKNVWLYRDDGLAVIHQTNGPTMGRIRKVIIALFKSEGFCITIDTNLIEIDFLDVSFYLEMAIFFPYKKPNNSAAFITKQLPSMTNNFESVM